MLIADTLTGEIKADVAPKGEPSYSRKIGDKGSVGVSVSLDSAPNASVDFHTYTRPGMYSWIVAFGDRIAQAGPVWTYQVSDNDRTLDVSCGGLLSLFARRVTRNPNGHTAIVDPSEDLTYTGLSLRGIMRQLVADNMAQQHYALPVVLPAAEAGTAERTYYGYSLKSIADNMKDLSEVINGPEFDFAPEFTSGGKFLQWSLLIGNPMLGDQQSNAVWDYGAERAPVGHIDVDVDGSAAPVTRVWVKGEGTERAMRSGFAEDTSLVAQGYPATDYVDGDHTTATVQQTLEDYADADLRDFRYPMEKWSCDVHIAETAGMEHAPALGNWQLGDAPMFAVDRHPWLPRDTYRRRILGYSNGSASTITLELSEAPESGAS